MQRLLNRIQSRGCNGVERWDGRIDIYGPDGQHIGTTDATRRTIDELIDRAE